MEGSVIVVPNVKVMLAIAGLCSFGCVCNLIEMVVNSVLNWVDESFEPLLNIHYSFQWNCSSMDQTREEV
jgi:hypothetical protein